METLQLEPNFIVTTNFLFTEYKSLQKDTFLHLINGKRLIKQKA